MKNLNELFDRLNINPDNGLILLDNDLWDSNLNLPSRIRRLLKNTIKPNALFCLDNKPLILFFENPKDKRELHKQVWNFNESPIVIIIEKGGVEIFNGFEYKKELESLAIIGNEKQLTDFSYFELVTGKSWELYKTELNSNNRIDYYLLGNINEARKVLVSRYNLEPRIANALIGKCIFVRYLIDRKVKINIDGHLSTWDNDGFCELLTNIDKTQSFFQYLKKKFNGDDVFPLHDEDYSQITNDSLSVLVSLLKSEKLLSGQQSLFDLYDFSIIPIEFISNVYELFIGQENQEKESAYYTPLFLVDYILNETIEKSLAENATSFKVLDPSCGSGIFLVENLRKIIEYNFPNNNNCDKEKIKKLAKENIFGVDKDRNAIQVAIFSIYLTLLDYQTPADIETFKFPNLLGTNFFEADFFDESHVFNDVFAKTEFDYIVGNPPWKRGKGGEKKPLFVKYIEQRHRKESEKSPCISIGNAEIAQAFVLRAMDFSSSKTSCALIINSKSLYNSGGKEFRNYFLHNNRLNRIFELAPVRREVFNSSNDSAIAPAAVLFFQNSKGEDTLNNIVEHVSVKPSRFFSMFKILAIYRSDIKQVEQHLLSEYDWLWKTLVYGSYLDFNFIKRLKDNYPTIGDIIKDEKRFIVKQGLKRKDGKIQINAEELLGWDFLDIAQKNTFMPFILKPQDIWSQQYVGYIYRINGKIQKDIFEPPVLLLKETVNSKFESIAAISRKNILFTDKVTAIKSLENNWDDYYNIIGILNSTFFSYYIFQTASTSGIMIEQQINDDEKWVVPYVNDQTISKLTKELEALYQNELFFESDLLELEKRNKRSQINSIINNSLSFSKIDNSLIEYTNEVIIPMQMRHKNYKKLQVSIKDKDDSLTEYADLFLERFEPLFAKRNKQFIVRIIVSPQIIAMFFETADYSQNNSKIVWETLTDSNMLKLAIYLSTQKVSDKLFVQKDIRGFEKERFYIIKPNEKRLWHKAIGYMDVEEFMDAILVAGRRQS